MNESRQFFQSAQTMKFKTSYKKFIRFLLTVGLVLFFFQVFLPFLTRHVPTLKKMSEILDENAIDPSRYYYTDVDQVKEAEQYIRSVLTDIEKQKTTR